VLQLLPQNARLFGVDGERCVRHDDDGAFEANESGVFAHAQSWRTKGAAAAHASARHAARTRAALLHGRAAPHGAGEEQGRAFRPSLGQSSRRTAQMGGRAAAG
jgi:hypothetical protein